MAEFVGRYAKASARLESAIAKRAAAMAVHDESVQQCRRAVSDVTAELAKEFGNETAARLLDIPVTEVARSRSINTRRTGRTG